jgi:Ca2+/Na+ antiporter
MKKILLSILFGLDILTVQSQESPAQQAGMDSIMRNNGRIYVVVAVMLVILVGLIAYMVRTDRKISRVEKETS